MKCGVCGCCRVNRFGRLVLHRIYIRGRWSYCPMSGDLPVEVDE